MSAKIAKTIARQKEKIAEGNFYEAHQQLRVISARYLKAADYTSASDVLSNGSLLLLRAGQGGSGGDLAILLINDVYIKGEQPCNEANKAKAIEILRAFPREEPTRKRFVGDMISWSVKFGDSIRGDPELHHAAGSLYAEDGEAYEAERHLLLGTPSSPTILATLHHTWYHLDSPQMAGLYASRSILPYLQLGNLQSALKAHSQFTSLLLTHNPSLNSQPLESSKSSIRLFPSLPLLNFLSLLLLACPKGDAQLYKQLTKQYSSSLKDTQDLWGDMLANIAEIWFGIRLPRQAGNPLFDMMGSMLFGGGQKPPANQSAPAVKAVTAPPPTMDLD